jgi:hypothetical protein
MRRDEDDPEFVSYRLHLLKEARRIAAGSMKEDKQR